MPIQPNTPTPLLDGVDSPADLRKLPEKQLAQLADEVRCDMVNAVSNTGGHLGAGLGVVELTVALHHVFDTPHDRVIWDVGHQGYPHKILTGRRAGMSSIRQEGGLSGFVRRSESPYDAFGTAHSSTSISAGLGMAIASEMDGIERNVIAVIGDGSMSAGMAYEAMNNAGSGDHRLIVILNDNDMSIDPPVGALSAYLTNVLSSKPYLGLRDLARGLSHRIFPRKWQDRASRAEAYARGIIHGGTLFDELGFYYLGPIDGHNLDHLLPVLKNVRDARDKGPFLIHVRTNKGHGYAPAEQAADKYHGVSKFDVVSGKQSKPKSNAPSYTGVFASALKNIARQDDKVLAITAAMPSGTGLAQFAEEFPARTFDVGIAEQHAVTFAAGLACEGFKPYVCIYSTFLQRGYDQLVHDVAIQGLPVRFILDRAGYVGADGQTHHGAYDLAYIGCLPDFVFMVPSDEAELVHMVTTANAIDNHPSAIRYPRGEGVGVELPEQGEILPLGKGRIIEQGDTIAFLALGPVLHECAAASEHLRAQGYSVTVADARFAKPLDQALLDQLVERHQLVITVEEGSIGGFGAAALEDLAKRGKLSGGCDIRTVTMPDRFIDHGGQGSQRKAAGLDTESLVKLVTSALET